MDIIAASHRDLPKNTIAISEHCHTGGAVSMGIESLVGSAAVRAEFSRWTLRSLLRAESLQKSILAMDE